MRTKYCIADSRLDTDCRDSLVTFGYELIYLPPFSKLAAPVSSHPDMLLNFFGGKLFVHKDYYTENTDIIDKISAASHSETVTCEDVIGPSYPFDVIFNSFVFKDHFIGNLKVASVKLKNAVQSVNMKSINVKQGYSKCAVCSTDSFIITSDKGIAKAVSAIGDVLTVADGSIELCGYDHGFIGGASGFDPQASVLYFCGDISLHPCGDMIRAYAKARGISVVSLSERPLYDYGTLFFIP